MSAVSRKLTPASSAASITTRVSSRPRRRPKLLHPRPATVTSRPPRRRVGSGSGAIEPLVYQTARDRYRRREGEPVVRPGARPAELRAREPAHVLELLVAHGCLSARVFREEPEHQRARERPRLRARIA